MHKLAKAPMLTPELAGQVMRLFPHQCSCGKPEVLALPVGDRRLSLNLAFVTPRQRFEAEKVSRLVDHMDAGGEVVIAAIHVADRDALKVAIVSEMEARGLTPMHELPAARPTLN
jgi:hypothetical protein